MQPPFEVQEVVPMAVIENHDDDLLLRKESIEMEQQDKPGFKSSSPNDNPSSRLSLVVYNPDPKTSPLGKEKKKGKEMMLDDKNAPITTRSKNKPSSAASKGKQAILNSCTKSLRHKQERYAVHESSGPTQMKSPTMIRAEEVRSSLGHEHPSFLKLLVRSHVGSCFWMSLPVSFCKQHLPREDIPVVLENECGEEFVIKYISKKTGLSAGLRKFVTAHKLVEGDVLIFQLIAPAKFKVYVIRSNDLSEVDGALSLLNLDAVNKKINEGGRSSSGEKRKHPSSLSLTVIQKKNQTNDLSISALPFVLLEEQSGTNSEEVASEVLQGFKFPGAAASSFKDTKMFEEFHIVVNGFCIDSELPELIRRKYYSLCRCKNAFLHEHFMSGLHYKLAVGVIFELVNTAEAIRGCKLTTPQREFEKWDKSLRSFELLGFNVGFLQARLRRLTSLAFNKKGASEAKRYWEAKAEQDCCEYEISSLEMKLKDLKEASRNYDADVATLEAKAESYELMFKREVNAPW